LLITVIIVKL